MNTPITSFGVSSNGAYWQFWYIDPETGKKHQEGFGAKAEMSDRAVKFKARERAAELGGNVARGKDAKGPTVSIYSERWLGLACAGVARTTEASLTRSVAVFLEFLANPNRRMGSVKPSDAEDFRAWLLERTAEADEDDDEERATWSPFTVSRFLMHVKAMFAKAAAERAINIDPFMHVPGIGAKADTAWEYIPVAALAKLTESSPDAAWRAAFMLTRLAGLRINEARKVAWSDIDWTNRTLIVFPAGRKQSTVQSTKRRQRIVPLVPELYTFLRGAFDEAPAGERGPLAGFPRNNVYRIVAGILAKAGQSPVRPFHDLRKSRQTDWMGTYPEPVVAAWMGNSVGVGREFYFQVTDQHVASATCAQRDANVTQQSPNPPSPDPTQKDQ